MHRGRKGHAPAAQCIVEHESGPRHTTFGQTSGEVSGQAFSSGSDMQSARMAPGVGRQLLRLGAGRSVRGGGTVGLGPGTGLNPDSLQLALCASAAAPAYLCPATLCQGGRPGE